MSDDSSASISSSYEKETQQPPIIPWTDVRTILTEKIEQIHQNLCHLIYPLNYSNGTVDLIPRQERFLEIYEREYTKWSYESITSKLPTVFDEEFSSEISGLNQMPLETKIVCLRRLLILFISSNGYESWTRTLLLHFCHELKISEDMFVCEVEENLLKEIQLNDSSIKSRLDEEDGSQVNNVWSRRKWLYASAGVLIGGAACSLTAGMAAPIFMPAILSAVGLTGAAFLTGTSGVAVMATIFGIAGAGMASYRVSRRFADLKDFTFIPLKDVDRNRNLRVCITISGWIKTEADFVTPWIETYLQNTEEHLSIQSEVYCLAFEKQIMLSLGRAMQDFIAASAVTLAASEMLKYAVTAAASAAILLPVAVLQAGDLIDNPWTLGLDRARKAGKALAEALRRGAQGRRPVTLIGYSLGALVIFTCLQELARAILYEDSGNSVDAASQFPSTEDLRTRGAGVKNTADDSSDNQSETISSPPSLFGIIENVVMLGLPTHLPAPSVWVQLRALVSGRFVHCYSDRDWVLKFLYRTSSPTAQDIAGLGPIADVSAVENWDVSEFVTGHAEYQTKLAEILKMVDL